jgi:DNA (cytosine-5)-methyltransferase 1
MQLTLFPKDETNIGDDQSWFSTALNILKVSETPGWPDNFGKKLINLNQDSLTKDIRVLSLFSGAGGLDIGFHDAGFKIIECVELEKDFAATLEYNSVQGRRLEGSNIKCINIKDYNPELENIDFIIGGPPCQTFSAAGARAAGVNGTDDDRGNLFKEYVRILKQLNPKGFLFENVYRIVGAQGGNPWKEIKNAFREVGYTIKWRILDAADYGVPQFRERLIIVGLQEGEYYFPVPSHGPDSSDNRPYYTASKAIEGIISREKTGLNGRHGHLLNDIPPGLNYSFYTERMGHPFPHFSWRSKFSDYLYKADPETPVRTIKAQGGQYTGPFHWNNRTFSIEEIKRLQTFPDDYIINGSRLKVIKQIGNSVPPQFARILALSIAQQVFRVSMPFKIEVLADSQKLYFRSRKNKLTEIYARKAAEAIKIKYPDISDNVTTSEREKIFFQKVDNLVFKKVSQNSNWDYYIESKIINRDVSIQLWDVNRDKQQKYKFTIQPNDSKTLNSNINRIILQSFSEDTHSITAIWKYFEYVIRKNFHKDDLIQLFGYYQYPNLYSFNFSYENFESEDPDFWILFNRIINSNIAGKILHRSEASDILNINEDMLIPILQKMKTLGYEIRNHNTNSQIKEGFILVPYLFPSLNERSLQRLTEL